MLPPSLAQSRAQPFIGLPTFWGHWSTAIREASKWTLKWRLGCPSTTPLPRTVGVGHHAKITGTTADRPQLKKLVAVLAHGDVVIVPAVDRLSRDTTDLLNIARDMQRAGAGIRSLAEPFLDTTSDFAEIVFAILGVAAKLEHRRIKERTARGRADAKAKGVKFGRKPKLTPHQQREAVRRRDVDGETLRSIGRSYNVSAQTISRLVV
jgi:DNA invertase Pin-like site-specific DNA recombinase